MAATTSVGDSALSPSKLGPLADVAASNSSELVHRWDPASSIILLRQWAPQPVHLWRHEQRSAQRGFEEFGRSFRQRPLRVTILDAREDTWVKPWLKSHTWRITCRSGPTSATGRNMSKSSTGRKEADDLKDGKKPTDGSYLVICWLVKWFSVPKHAPWGDKAISSSCRMTVVLLALKPSRITVTSCVRTDNTGAWMAEMLLRQTQAPEKRIRKNKYAEDQRPCGLKHLRLPKVSLLDRSDTLNTKFMSTHRCCPTILIWIGYPFDKQPSTFPGTMCDVAKVY